MIVFSENITRGAQLSKFSQLITEMDIRRKDRYYSRFLQSIIDIIIDSCGETWILLSILAEQHRYQ
ncbi:unnamed protein product, partial [Nesidiocoris tenuis]